MSGRQVSLGIERGLFASWRGRRLKENLLGYLYILPATIVLTAFHFLPVGYAFYISLHKWKVKKVAFLGWANYTQALADSRFWKSLVVTVYYVIGTVPFTITLSLIIAYLLFQKIKGLSIYRTIYFLPYITSTVASAAVWLWIFNPRHGPLNQLLDLVGIPAQRWLNEPRGIIEVVGSALGFTIPKWAGGPSLALVGIMVFAIWRYVGYDVVIFLAGLGNIPYELYEAAKIDGAGRWQLFRRITLPLLSPTIFFLVVMSVIWSFQAFADIYIMTAASGQQLGGPLHTTATATIYIFDQFYSRLNIGYASSMAFILFWIILVLTTIQNRFGERLVFYT